MCTVVHVRMIAHSFCNCLLSTRYGVYVLGDRALNRKAWEWVLLVETDGLRAVSESEAM